MNSALPIPKEKEQVRRMFNSIAGSYDRLNRILSLGIDHRWRKKAISIIRQQYDAPVSILDIATGTADLAIAEAAIGDVRITGVDIAEEMLEAGRRKVTAKGLHNKISLLIAEAEQLPFPEASFDVVTVAFGVRNFHDLRKGLAEMHRVLKPNGMALILEFSLPGNKMVRVAYNLYFLHILPVIGRLVSGNSYAYKYLPLSVLPFPHGKDFTAIMTEVGFSSTTLYPQSCGISSIYTGLKKIY